MQQLDEKKWKVAYETKPQKEPLTKKEESAQEKCEQIKAAH